MGRGEGTVGGSLLAGLDGVVRVLLPVSCPGCGCPDVVVCPSCRHRVLSGPALHRILVDGTPAVASASWRGPAAGLVGGLKERGRTDVLDVLAAALARAVALLLWPAEGGPRHDAGPPVPPVLPGAGGPVLLVPPPATWRAVVRRRDRPGERLAGHAADRLRRAGADVVAVPALALRRRVVDQAGLGRVAREQNLTGAHRLRPGLGGVVAGRDVVVVDDVVTSGATAVEAGATLRAAGARVVGTASVAHA
ncbi:ComF family protein [Aquipuribacter nitratireducens]|uniref:ComF family protein n=1 Tax=Aquipuribacter nitratireducens TaxID=650104 RepID=A0ABW0GLP2_9MICO